MKHHEFDIEKLKITTFDMYNASIVEGGRIYVKGIGDVKVMMPVPKIFCNDFRGMYFQDGLKITAMLYDDEALGFIRYDEVDHKNAVEALTKFKTRILNSELFFDGQIIYGLDDYETLPEMLDNTEFFEHVKLYGYEPTDLLSRTIDEYRTYSAIKCKGVISPPLWDDMISTLTRLYNVTDLNLPFKSIDDSYSCNIQGILKVCDMSSQYFGANTIECFDLPYYMLVFKTVNLPALPNKTKTTSVTGTKYTDMIAFHMGKFNISETFEQIKAVKHSLKYITSYCIIKNDVLDLSKIYRNYEQVA